MIVLRTRLLRGRGRGGRRAGAGGRVRAPGGWAAAGGRHPAAIRPEGPAVTGPVAEGSTGGHPADPSGPLPGTPFPLGATAGRGGTNFAVASGVADRVDLCLFDETGAEDRVSLRDFDAGVWHGFVPGIEVGQRYGYRIAGPYDPARGLRCNPAKLLLDPYAKALAGTVTPGPEIEGYAAPDSDAPSAADSAAKMPRSLVTSEEFAWTDDDRPARRYEDTIIYEAHVKGLTMRHPDVPPPLRGSYAGLAHEAVIGHLLDLGVTTVELLPVHESVPESFLVERGLTNYWGYNTIGYFAPHQAYSAAVRAGAARRAGRRVQGDGERAAPGGPRGAPGRGVQPHRGGQRARPHPVLPRPGQPGLLPPGRWGPAALLRHHRHRELAQRRGPGHPQADHGLAALLGHPDARGRVPLRPGSHARPAGGRVRPGVGVL